MNQGNENHFEVIENTAAADTMNLPRMKSIKEMVELTGLAYSHLRGLCVQNKIVFIKTGKKYLINYDRFIDYLNHGDPS